MVKHSCLGTQVVICLEIRRDSALDLLRVLSEAQRRHSLLYLAHRGRDAEHDGCSRVPTETRLKNLGERRVAERDMILPALGKHGYDLCQEEQRLVDMLAFLDSHTFGISVGAAPSIRLGAAARCGAKRTWISHSGA